MIAFDVASPRIAFGQPVAAALAGETARPFIAVPTTYSGSEMTALYGILVGDEKRTQRDERCMARAVIYDPALTLALPAPLTATTGMNAAALFDLAAKLGAPQSLQSLGMAQADLDPAAALAVKATTWNPRPVDTASLRRLLDDAYWGRRPQA